MAYEMTEGGVVLWQYLNYNSETGKSGRLTWSSLITDLSPKTKKACASANCASN